MTKLESAKEIIKQKGGCVGIGCSECCLNGKYNCINCRDSEEQLQLAIRYKEEQEINDILYKAIKKGKEAFDELSKNMDNLGRVSLEEACSSLEEFTKAVRESLKPKYKPYTEPKLEWIQNPNKKIKNIQTGKEFLICGITKTDGYVLEIYTSVGKSYISMHSLVSNFVWVEDSTPCGEVK